MSSSASCLRRELSLFRRPVASFGSPSFWWGLAIALSFTASIIFISGVKGGSIWDLLVVSGGASLSCAFWIYGWFMLRGQSPAPRLTTWDKQKSRNVLSGRAVGFVVTHVLTSALFNVAILWGEPGTSSAMFYSHIAFTFIIAPSVSSTWRLKAWQALLGKRVFSKKYQFNRPSRATEVQVLILIAIALVLFVWTSGERMTRWNLLGVAAALTQAFQTIYMLQITDRGARGMMSIVFVSRLVLVVSGIVGFALGGYNLNLSLKPWATAWLGAGNLPWAIFVLLAIGGVFMACAYIFTVKLSLARDRERNKADVDPFYAAFVQTWEIPLVVVISWQLGSEALPPLKIVAITLVLVAVICYIRGRNIVKRRNGSVSNSEGSSNAVTDDGAGGVVTDASPCDGIGSPVLPCQG